MIITLVVETVLGIGLVVLIEMPFVALKTTFVAEADIIVLQLDANPWHLKGLSDYLRKEKD